MLKGKEEIECICVNEWKSWSYTFYCLDTCWDFLYIFSSFLPFDDEREAKELLALCQFCRTCRKKLLGDLSSEHCIFDLAIFHMYKVIVEFGWLPLT